jgi:hypothetical protein
MSRYQGLFYLMANEHDLTLLDSEMQEVISEVHKIDNWNLVEHRMPQEYFYVSTTVVTKEGASQIKSLAHSFVTNRWYDWDGMPCNDIVKSWQEFPHSN